MSSNSSPLTSVDQHQSDVSHLDSASNVTSRSTRAERRATLQAARIRQEAGLKRAAVDNELYDAQLERDRLVAQQKKEQVKLDEAVSFAELEEEIGEAEDREEEDARARQLVRSQGQAGPPALVEGPAHVQISHQAAYEVHLPTGCEPSVTLRQQSTTTRASISQPTTFWTPQAHRLSRPSPSFSSDYLRRVHRQASVPTVLGPMHRSTPGAWPPYRMPTPYRQLPAPQIITAVMSAATDLPPASVPAGAPVQLTASVQPPTASSVDAAAPSPSTMDSRVASPRTQDTSDIGYHPDINRFVNKDTETDTSQYTQNCPTATRSRVNDYRYEQFGVRNATQPGSTANVRIDSDPRFHPIPEDPYQLAREYEKGRTSRYPFSSPREQGHDQRPSPESGLCHDSPVYPPAASQPEVSEHRQDDRTSSGVREARFAPSLRSPGNDLPSGSRRGQERSPSPAQRVARQSHVPYASDRGRSAD